MNPLTVVVGYAQLLATRHDLDEEARGQVSRILQEARECVRIIERARQAAPVVTPRVPEGAAPDPSPAGQVLRRRVLVVDDEPVILKLTNEILGGQHDVIGAPTADDALRRLLIEDVDVVLLDLNLGGPIGGRQLFQTLQLQQPEVAERVVFMSGGAVGQEEQAFLANCGRECLQKPFNIKMLRETVQRLVG
jgi:CheY-like chemotaxis protein